MAVLTVEESDDLYASWLLVEKHIRDNGLRFFINLFTKHPDIQEKNFPTMGVNDLERLRDHGTGVLRDIEMMVMHVKNGDDASLVAKIHSVTQNHYRRGINTIASYQAMNLVLLDTLSQILGPGLTPGAAKAWNSLLDTMVDVVSKEIDRLDEEAAVILTAKINARRANEMRTSN